MMTHSQDKLLTQTKWSIDQVHSEITFKVKHLMISHVQGAFKTFDASIYTYGRDFTTAEIDLWIKALSITTGDTKRDEHLTGPDFLDADKHKQITFNSSMMAKPDQQGNSVLWGEMTMVGITKDIKLNVNFGGVVKDPWGNEKAGFSVTGKINRRDWGLEWNTLIEAGGVMVGDEVIISCEFQLINSGQNDLTMELEPS